MGWASRHIEKLLAGEAVTFRPRGNSMSGIVEDGQLVIVVPITPGCDPRVGDVVLCKVKGRQYLHLVKATDAKRFLIGNNRGGINGWTSRKNVFGVMKRG